MQSLRAWKLQGSGSVVPLLAGSGSTLYRSPSGSLFGPLSSFSSSLSYSSRLLRSHNAASTNSFSRSSLFLNSSLRRAAVASASSYHSSATSNNAAQSGSTPSAVPLSKLSESFLDGTSSIYVEDMYRAWKKDPGSVHASWDSFFRQMEGGTAPGEAYTPPPSIRSSAASAPSRASSAATAAGAPDVDQKTKDSMRLLLLVRAFQVRGHTLARLNPLTNSSLFKHQFPELDPATYGFTEADMDRPIFLEDKNLLSGFLHSESPHRTLRDILARLKETYCGSIGFEYMHIPDREECNWLRQRIETPVQYSFTKEEKLHILDRLTWSGLFEKFLGIKFPQVKRFGLDGCEVLIPGMKSMVDLAADHGTESVVIGMPHRGRLNVLANVVRKPLEQLLHEFNPEGNHANDLGQGSGDVKYHLGTSYDRPTVSGKKVHLSLVANPSHLEAVDPVVVGKTKAKQVYSDDTEQKKALAVLLHGDASFAGQGVVYETFDMGQWKNYSTGGVIHIIVNNQLGFTTDPKVGRLPMASPYPTEVAKTVGAPIFHVNGDDPEAVVHCMRLAVEYRHTFNKDVVVDIVCYRREGHNEGDEPSFTQPLMYKMIKKHKPTLDVYREHMLKEGVVTQEDIKAMEDRVMQEYNSAYERASTYEPKNMDWLDSYWKGYKSPEQLSKIRSTALPKDTLMKIANTLTDIPQGFKLHRQLEKLVQRQRAMFESEDGINWATAEALAFGSLLLEKNLVRLSGQDVERGTFSHRHAVLHDNNNGNIHTPLAHLSPEQGEFQITNSPLSEFAVLGFELGFSLENPNSLVCWEAQFGDFSNGAQVIIDQFISAGESKWFRQSGIVLLLPHGYDGAGPEHSSARLERFLQMSDSDPDEIPSMVREQRTQIQRTNWQVVNCTTPANYFHVLRRQVHRDFRKPLIVISPKRLLKYPKAVSPLSDFLDSGNHLTFRRVIPDTCPTLVPPDQVRRLIFCSGNVYYDLEKEREERGFNDVAIVRIEQLAPFPFDHVESQAKLYSNAEITWAQEEPKNMGAWNWINPHIRSSLRKSRGLVDLRYVGRAPSASPATGSPKTHKNQLRQLLNAAFA
ncbi:oxoglutarate dehydrogenase (succinyl-transferring) [Balamuthia mandrillaris]